MTPACPVAGNKAAWDPGSAQAKVNVGLVPTPTGPVLKFPAIPLIEPTFVPAAPLIATLVKTSPLERFAKAAANSDAVVAVVAVNVSPFFMQILKGITAKLARQISVRNVQKSN